MTSGRKAGGRRFVALAPDLYGGTTTHEESEAQQLITELPVERAVTDLGGAPSTSCSATTP